MSERLVLGDAPLFNRSGAVLSPCGAYRYRLWRRWDTTEPSVAFVMLNPSTADAAVDDPTIRKCVGFARRWGLGGVRVVNLYAYRATDPRDLWRAQRSGVDIVGWPHNRDHVRAAASDAGVIVAAWGANAPTEAGVAMAAELCRYGDVWCLGTTRGDAPRHPLMLGYATPLKLFAGAAR